jgi:hypothetical protein
MTFWVRQLLYRHLLMWKTPTERKDFVFVVRMGLRRGLSLIRGMKRSLILFTKIQSLHLGNTLNISQLPLEN